MCGLWWGPSDIVCRRFGVRSDRACIGAWASSVVQDSPAVSLPHVATEIPPSIAGLGSKVRVASGGDPLISRVRTSAWGHTLLELGHGHGL